MAISSHLGSTPWTAQELADATGVTVTAATRKVQKFEAQLARLLAGMRAIDPRLRACDVVEILMSAMTTGGRLADLDRNRLAARLRELADSAG